MSSSAALTRTVAAPAVRRTQRAGKTRLWPRRAGKLLGLTLLLLAAVSMIVPFVWTLSTSLKGEERVLQVPPELIPSDPTVASYQRLGEVLPFARIVVNTFIVTITATIAQVLTSAMAGYGLARFRFRGRSAVLLMYLATLMVPFQVTIVPLFLMMRWFGWINSLQAIVLPLIASAFGVFLFRQYFAQMPREFEEAAALDGAGPWRTFWSIAFPYAKPATATHGILAFMASWNAFLWPLFVARDESAMTLQVGLNILNGGRYSTDFALVMAGVVIAVAPVIFVFALLQRHISGGLLLGNGGR